MEIRTESAAGEKVTVFRDRVGKECRLRPLTRFDLRGLSEEIGPIPRWPGRLMDEETRDETLLAILWRGARKGPDAGVADLKAGKFAIGIDEFADRLDLGQERGLALAMEFLKNSGLEVRPAADRPRPAAEPEAATGTPSPTSGGAPPAPATPAA